MTFLTQTGEPLAKQKILEAALLLFTRHGIAGTSIRDIALESGFTNPALYKHFSGKNELASLLFERCYGWVASELASVVDSAELDDDRLDAFLLRYLQLLDERLDAVVYVDAHLHHFWREMPASLRRRTVVTMVRELVEPRLVGDGDVESWVVAVVGLLSQVARMTYLGGLPTPAADRFPDIRTIVHRTLG